MATTKESSSTQSSGAVLEHPPVIVDLGPKSRKKIERLKKGEGPLHEAITDTVSALKADGVVGKDVQVVVVVVEKLPDGVVLPGFGSWN